MRARPSLVALLALSRRIQVAAGASGSFARLAPLSIASYKRVRRSLRCSCSRAKCGLPQALPECSVAQACTQVCAGCPSCGGQRTVVPSRSRITQHRLVIPSLFGPAQSRSTMGQAGSGAGHTARAAHVAMLCHRNAMQGRCSPSRGLTLPSSGQSTGCARRLPLMSNVRCQCCEACTSLAATERGACALSSIGSPLGRCLSACSGSRGSPRASHRRRPSPLATG